MLKGAFDRIGWWLGAGERRRARREAAWREAAERQDGELTEDQTTVWKWNPPTLEAPLEDALVHVDLHAVQVGNSRAVFTRARADYPLGIGPRYKVYRAGWSGSLGNALGFEDASLGDPDFDDAFIVRTGDVEATRRAWTGRARRALRERLGGDGVVQTTQQRVTLTLPGVVEEAERLQAAVVLVGDLAGYGREWLEAMRAIPEAEPVYADGPWDDRTTPGSRLGIRGHSVHVHPVVLGSGLWARATAPCARDIAPVELGLNEAGVLFDEPPDGLLGPLALELLPQIPGATIGCDAAAVRVTVDIESGPGAMHRAAQLAAHLARGEGGQGGFR